MGRLIAVVSVYNEQALIVRAVTSLFAGGVDSVHVFDGAWGGFGGADGTGASDDDTMPLAGALGCVLHHPEEMWPSQEAKRTRMFHEVEASDDDHVLVFDADEELEGAFPPLVAGQHYNLMVRCVGPNDMPGVRGEWPNGDYYAGYKPEVRVFAYDDKLHCKWPGGYWDWAGRIEPYANAKGDPLLPVVDGVSFLHHGNDRSALRKEQKLAFYESEHPRRRQRQKEVYAVEPW